MNSLKAPFLGKELRRPKSVSKQTRGDIISAHFVEEY
jgi:hypothetical protein